LSGESERANARMGETVDWKRMKKDGWRLRSVKSL